MGDVVFNDGVQTWINLRLSPVQPTPVALNHLQEVLATSERREARLRQDLDSLQQERGQLRASLALSQQDDAKLRTGLVTTSHLASKLSSTHARGMCGHQVGGPKPLLQRKSTAMHQRSGGWRNLVVALIALPQCTAFNRPIPTASTTRAAKGSWPIGSPKDSAHTPAHRRTSRGIPSRSWESSVAPLNLGSLRT